MLFEISQEISQEQAVKDWTVLEVLSFKQMKPIFVLLPENSVKPFCEGANITPLFIVAR